MWDTALLDVDGTLVDSTYLHVLAWQRAFRQHGFTVSAAHLHRHIGMGGDQIVSALLGEDVEREQGEPLRAAWRASFDPLLADVTPLDGARELVAALREQGLTVVLASSAPAEHIEHYLDLIDVRQLVSAWTTAEDVETTKPAPDLLEVALRKGGGTTALTVGDSVWDCEAARRIGLESHAVRTGGICEADLLGAGARAVHESLPDLVAALSRMT